MPKSTTGKQDQLISENLISFLGDLLGPNHLWSDDDLTDWVQENFHPGDVFSESELSDWSYNNGFKKFE